jgi:hypothetical protein
MKLWVERDGKKWRGARRRYTQAFAVLKPSCVVCQSELRSRLLAGRPGDDEAWRAHLEFSAELGRNVDLHGCVGVAGDRRLPSIFAIGASKPER